MAGIKLKIMVNMKRITGTRHCYKPFTCFILSKNVPKTESVKKEKKKSLFAKMQSHETLDGLAK